MESGRLRPLFLSQIMSRKKQKYYVVWQGQQPGIYSSWEECEKQVKGVVGSKFKSFDTLSAAEQAYRLGPSMFIGNTNSGQQASIPGLIKPSTGKVIGVDSEGMTYLLPDRDPSLPVPVLNSLAVDAACSGNPGVMEYQGVHVASRQRLFHYKAPVGTNNIGEFLAIVHGLAYLKQHNIDMVIYSDSMTAQGWIRAKQCRTKLAVTEETRGLYDLIHRAEAWLHNNTYNTTILKWDTDLWGEIPADFGRK